MSFTEKILNGTLGMQQQQQERRRTTLLYKYPTTNLYYYQRSVHHMIAFFLLLLFVLHVDVHNGFVLNKKNMIIGSRKCGTTTTSSSITFTQQKHQQQQGKNKRRQHQNISINRKYTLPFVALQNSNSDNGDTGVVTVGETVLVIGGTGGVGQLVSKKLINQNRKVRITSRNIPNAIELMDDERIEVVPLNLVPSSNDNLNEFDKQMDVALQDVTAVVITIGTTAFPTLKWQGGNTPQNIDHYAVERIANTIARYNNNIEDATSPKRIKKMILVTSVGVDRIKEMPFLILNLFGVLDSKKLGEEAVKKVCQTSANNSCKYVILRPGRLVGGPFTNLDVAKLLQIQGGSTNGVQIQLGDTLLGDCKRDACSEAIVQCLLNSNCSNVEFSIISDETLPSLSNQQWTNEFQKLR